MDSFFAKNRLSAYIDGVLPEQEAIAVAEAIARDPELQAEYAAVREAVGAMRQHGPVSAPEGFKARVMAAVDREPAQTGVVVQLRRVIARVPVEALAVAAAALLVIFATTSRMQVSPPTAGLSTPPPEPAQTNREPSSPNAPSAPVSSSPSETHLAASPDDTPPKPVGEPPAKKSRTGAERTGITPRSAVAPGQTQGSAYVPDWEEEVGNTPAAFGGTEGFALAVADEAVLRKLHMLTERAGGKMLDESNQVLRPFMLSSEQPDARVLLLVPVEQAQQMRGQLEGLGAVSTPPPASAPMLAAGYTGFFVDARLLSEPSP